MSNKDNVLQFVAAIFIVSVFLLIVYLGFDFTVCAARHLDYPIWKVSVLYFTSVVIVVWGSIVNANR